ncbi:RNA 2',3'-cyclic phosphodiesterase [Candidatus Woesearchaeota archaeon CG10_big_fil_rev_8_21_14_0_10_37_12]|nr:MAG: RNA 2',3'-cyclic phosphodiesterase [Candidatus Woesearchaeota archaeon CG10_big_fil_rev_8_21_14_0_10_37_12]
MTLFISIRLPDEIQQYVQTIHNLLPKQHSTFVLSKQYHITLKFLGDVDKEKLEQIKTRLSSIFLKPFTLHLAPIGYFPDTQKIRVIWLGVEPQKEVGQLHEELEKILKDLFTKDERWHPHITLARVKTIQNKKLFANMMQQIQIEPKVFTVHEFVLMESKLENGKYNHYEIEKYKVNGSS